MGVRDDVYAVLGGQRVEEREEPACLEREGGEPCSEGSERAGRWQDR